MNRYARSLTLLRILVALVAIGPAARAHAFPGPGETFIVKEDLGTLGGADYSSANAINSSRQITGRGDYSTAFLWTPPGPMVELEPGQDLQWGSDINDAGQVTGTGFGFIEFWDGFLWTPPGPAVGLEPPPEGLFDEWPSGINELGEIVGGFEDPPIRPFLWQAPGPMIDLGTLGGTGGTATDINESSAVVGSSDLPGDDEGHAFYWTDDDGMIDLGAAGPGTGSGAQALNDANEIVGTVGYYGQEIIHHAAYWASPDDELVDLGTIDGFTSNAMGINNDGVIVGRSTVSFYTNNMHGFRLEPGGEMTSLGTLGGENSEAADINDDGHIVGSAEMPNGDTHAIAWWVYTVNGAPCDCGLANPEDDGDYFDVLVASTSGIDARLVDANTLTLGDAKEDDTHVARDARTGELLAKLADQNGDGLVDLVVKFEKAALIENGDWSREAPALWLQGAFSDRARGISAVIPLGATSIQLAATGGSGSGAAPAAIALTLASSPNPFAGSTHLRFSIPEAADAEVAIYDATGRRVATLLAERVATGERSVVWDRTDARGSRVGPGIYFARLSALGREATTKLVVVE
jgi:probable HAF family extracellular repeat protein